MPVYYSSPYLNHFSQPDTIIPDASNPQSFNRYSYALNNPVRYNDPSGNKPCSDEFGCEEVKKIAQPNNSIINLLTATIMSETNSGTYPDDMMETIGWIYLNRTTKIKTQDTLWKAVKGDQSSVTCYYYGCKGKSAIFPGLPKRPNAFELDLYWANVVKQGLESELSGGWERSYEVAKSVYEKWEKYGTGSSADPTSRVIAGGATDFIMVKPNNSKYVNSAYDSYRHPGRAHFNYYFLGPSYISGLGQERYMFVTNLEYSNQEDIYK